MSNKIACFLLAAFLSVATIGCQKAKKPIPPKEELAKLSCKTVEIEKERDPEIRAARSKECFQRGSYQFKRSPEVSW